MQFMTNALTSHIVVMASEINLRRSWNKFWGAVEGQAGPILNVLSVVGVLLVAFALAKWAWERRRGGGGGFGGGGGGAVWGALLVGCLLSAPNVLIPMFLLVMDVVANAGISLWNNSV